MGFLGFFLLLVGAGILYTWFFKRDDLRDKKTGELPRKSFVFLGAFGSFIGGLALMLSPVQDASEPNKQQIQQAIDGSGINDSAINASVDTNGSIVIDPVTDKALSGDVKKEDFGDAWPFTVDAGRVQCVDGMYAVFEAGGQTYALNGAAKSKYAGLDSIWRDNPELAGTKVNIGPMIELALSRC